MTLRPLIRCPHCSHFKNPEFQRGCPFCLATGFTMGAPISEFIATDEPGPAHEFSRICGTHTPDDWDARLRPG